MIKPPPLDRIVRTIVTAMKPQRIVLFGSRARGDAHEDSDIDLMIEMNTALEKPYREMEIDKLFGLRDWSMDVFVYTPDEVRRLRGDVGTIVHVAEEEGEVLYERP